MRLPTDVGRHRPATAARFPPGPAERSRSAARPSESAIARIRPISAAGNASGSAVAASRCIARSIRRCPAARAVARPPPPGRGRRRRCAGRPPPPRRPPAAPTPRLRGMPSEAGSTPASAAGSGNTCVRRAVRLAQLLAEPGHQRAGQADRAGHGDLLPQHRAHRQLEAVPGAGHPQARPGGDQRRERRVLDQLQRDGIRVGRQVEHPAQPGDDLRQGGQFGKPHGRRAARCRRPGCDGHGALLPVQADRAAIGVARPRSPRPVIARARRNSSIAGQS